MDQPVPIRHPVHTDRGAYHSPADVSVRVWRLVQSLGPSYSLFLSQFGLFPKKTKNFKLLCSLGSAILHLLLLLKHIIVAGLSVTSVMDLRKLYALKDSLLFLLKVFTSFAGYNFV